MKVQKEHSTPTLQMIKNKKIDMLRNNLKNNLNNYIAINSLNEKENAITNKKIDKKHINFQKQKYMSENAENLEKRNISPFLIKFRNFYSFLYKSRQKAFGLGNNKKSEKKLATNCIKIKNIKNMGHNNLEINCMNINKIKIPLNFRDININKNERNKIRQKEDKYNKILYLQTTNSIKSINNSFFYSSRQKMINNNNNKNNTKNDISKINSNILYRNIMKKSQTFQLDKNIFNNIKDNNDFNLPSIINKKKNININLKDYQKITPLNKNRSIRHLNKYNSFLSHSNNNLELNSQLVLDNKDNYNILEEENVFNGKNNKIFLNSNDINTTTINLNQNHELKLKNKTKTFPLKKNLDLYYIYDLPPVNYYKDNFYYYNIFPSNCGWLIKKCFTHRTKWRECHCNNTNLFNFKWKEAVNNSEFFDLSLNKIQIINHFEFQSSISNKCNMFYNFSKYCEDKNIDVFKYLPFTIILDISNYQQFLTYKENYKKIFNNINDYIFESDSINNKIFDRRKISYKSLFPNNDPKFGIKLYCEIPKSHYNDKNLWIVKAPNLNRGRCVKVFNNFNDIFNYIKKMTEGKVDEYDIDKIKKEDINKNDNNINNINNNNNNDNNQKEKEENLSNDLINKNDNKEEKEYKYQTSIIIIQKYIEKPFLYKGRKCDIRIWVLLTHKMEVYMFKEGHLKASSVSFDVDNFDIFVHLTNYSLQKYNKCFSKFEKGNEISFKIFQEFINEQENKFNFREEIFPKFIEIIKHTMLCVKNKINLNNRNYCFEIFGYDFMMDEDKNIYLIEINTNPGLEISSDLIGELVPRMIDDALLLTVDDLFPTEYSKDCLNEKGKYKSKFHVEGYNDDENMWDYICDMKKNIDKDLFNSFSFNMKNFRKSKRRIKIKRFKYKK